MSLIIEDQDQITKLFVMALNYRTHLFEDSALLWSPGEGGSNTDRNMDRKDDR